MKRKLFSIMILLLFAFGLTGCDQLFGLVIPTTTTSEAPITTTMTTPTQTTTNLTTQLIENQQIHEIYLLALEAEATSLTYDDWLNSVQGEAGTPGEDGREILLQVASGYIQWKYVGDVSWSNLVTLASLIGPQGASGTNGKEIQLQVESGYIKWRYAGDLLWNNLLAISALIGPKGEDGSDGKEVSFQLTDTFLQWRYAGEDTWVNLIELASLRGEDGVDGSEVVLGINEGYLSWRYVDEVAWTELVAISTLAGEDGLSIQSVTINELGELIITYTDSSFANAGKVLNTHTVNFKDPNGYLIDTQQVLHGAVAAVPTAPVIEGYEFTGWSAAYDEVTTDLLILAEYVLQTHTVSFYDHSGALIQTSTINHFQDATPPVLDPRDHYELIGWNGDYTEITEDVSLYPIWQERIYNPAEIFQLANPSTVEIKIYGQWDDRIKLGSGFFISEDGILVTNHHVIESGFSATVIMSDETEYVVTSVIGYSEIYDLAILKIDAVSTPLSISSRSLLTGEPAYALGSPLGLTGSFSSGIISTSSRPIGSIDYIQITAPLSPGNSGGPLINQYGEVIGVNTATFVDGQNLNLAVNIEQLDLLDTSVPTTMEAMYQDYWGFDYYPWEVTGSETEPNNIQAEADLLTPNGVTISGSLADTEDVDWFEFAIEENMTITLMVFPDTSADLEMFVLSLEKADGTVLATGEIEKFDAFNVCFIQFDIEVSALETFYVNLSLDSSDPDITAIGYELFFHLN